MLSSQNLFDLLPRVLILLIVGVDGPLEVYKALGDVSVVVIDFSLNGRLNVLQFILQHLVECGEITSDFSSLGIEEGLEILNVAFVVGGQIPDYWG